MLDYAGLLDNRMLNAAPAVAARKFYESRIPDVYQRTVGGLRDISAGRGKQQVGDMAAVSEQQRDILFPQIFERRVGVDSCAWATSPNLLATPDGRRYVLLDGIILKDFLGGYLV
jgi:hypothetical protein